MWNHITLIDGMHEIPLNFTLATNGHFRKYHSNDMIDSVPDAVPEGYSVEYNNINPTGVPHIAVFRNGIIFAHIMREANMFAITINYGLHDNRTISIPISDMDSKTQWRLNVADIVTSPIATIGFATLGIISV